MSKLYKVSIELEESEKVSVVCDRVERGVAEKGAEGYFRDLIATLDDTVDPEGALATRAELGGVIVLQKILLSGWTGDKPFTQTWRGATVKIEPVGKAKAMQKVD